MQDASVKQGSDSLAPLPLCVDLDGTFVLEDTMSRLAFQVLKKSPYRALSMMMWWFKGRAFLKERLCQLATLDVESLTVNSQVLEIIRQEKQRGRLVLLVSGTHHTIADAVARHHAIFDEVVASDARVNLVSKNKASYLTNRFGVAGFDYIGNSFQDIAVWQQSRMAYTVTSSPRLLTALNKVNQNVVVV